jgi:hypothetical protein
MPLARILTRNPERTADLSTQLKQQGYSVEVARPDQTNLAPADLEIEFEVCERADVLDRAADLASELGADVAVAPGVLQMPPKPAAEPIMYGSTAPQPLPPETVAPEPVLSQKIVSQEVLSHKIMAEPEPETVRLSRPPAIEHGQERDPEREFEAAFAPVIEMPAAAQASQEVVEVPIMESEPMPPVAFLEESPAAEPIAPSPIAERHTEEHAAAPIIFPEPPRAADPMPYLAQLTPFSGRTNRADADRLEREQDAAPAVRRRDHSQIPERGKKVLQDGARVAAQTWAGALALAASTRASVRDHFEEYRKRAQVRSAEARAEHAARLLDLEQRRAEAHQRAAELELAREQAAARLMELVRQREPGLPPERLREQMPFEPVVPKQSQPSQSFYAQPPEQERRRAVPPVAASRPEPAVRSARAAITATPMELWRSIHPPLRPILTGAAAVTALFIMGIALGLFHSSRPPLASTTSHPSNGVTLQTGSQTGGVTVQTGSPKQQTAQPTAVPQAKPQPGQPAQVQAQSAATVAKPSPRVRQTHLVAEQSEKQIGDDVVIRHYSRPVPTQKPKQTGQQAGLKHFSDLEN